MLRERADTPRSGSTIAVIYTDNQAVLHTLRRMETKSGQARTQFIIQVTRTLRDRGIQVVFRWIPSHKGVKGNESADQAAKRAAVPEQAGDTQATRYLSAIYSLVDQISRDKWTEKWTHGTQGALTRDLLPEPSGAIRKLHAGLQKAESAILTQDRLQQIPTAVEYHLSLARGAHTNRVR
jgi:hypothetical protein